jgi:hypothetical protein
MKTFRVFLREGHSVLVAAKIYRHEGQQYVFDGEDDSEVQFFLDSEVTGIIIEQPLRSFNLLPPDNGSTSDSLPGANAGG